MYMYEMKCRNSKTDLLYYKFVFCINIYFFSESKYRIIKRIIRGGTIF